MIYDAFARAAKISVTAREVTLQLLKRLCLKGVDACGKV